MEISKAFRILELEETKEEGAIKQAYRNKLVKTNPEDDQEGFKRLREAYEEALAFSRKKEEPEGALVASPVSLFLGRVDEVYKTLPKRLERKQWEELIRDEIFDSLELAEEARRELFTYLEKNYRLPAEIWKLLCDSFFIPEHEQEFKEELPVGFVDFILRKAREGGEYDFTLDRFRGEPGADYDGFIEDFNELLELIAQKEEGQEQLEQIRVKIEEMEGYGILHPWFELEKAKYALIRGEKEEAERILMGVWEDREGDSRLLFGGAGILKACGRQEEAEEIFRQFAKREQMNGDVYASLLEMAEICLGRQEFEEAKEYAERAVKRYESGRTRELLDACNRNIIEKYIKKEQLTEEEAVHLSWAFVQADRAEEGLEYVRAHGLLTQDSADCHQAKAVLFLYNDLYPEAAGESRRWRECLSKEDKDYDWLRARSLDQEGRALWSVWRDKTAGAGEKSGLEELEEKILALFEEAIQTVEEERNFLLSKLLFLRELKRHQEVVSVCEEIIRLEPNYFWSYYYAQEAHAALRNAQEVIDYFYRGREIYEKQPDMYERAARVFSDFRQYKDMHHILRLAEEAEVTSFGLRVRKLEDMRQTADSSEKCQEADEFAEELISEMERSLKEEKQEEEERKLKDDLAEAYMERTYLHEKEEAKEIRRIPEMEKWLDRAVELQDTDWNRYYKGRFYIRWLPKPDQAYRELKICLDRGMDFGWMYYFLGKSLKNEAEFQKQKEAIGYLLKAHERLPESSGILTTIADIYDDRLEAYGQIEDGELALQYLDREREKFGSNYYDCWLYSRVYRNLGRLEEALRESQEALEKRYTAYHLSQTAYILECMGRNEEAKEYFIKSIEQAQKETEDKDSVYSYRRVYDIFRKLEQYDEGISFFRSHMNRLRTGKQREENLDKIKKLYRRKRDWKNALLTIEERYGHTSLTRYCCDNWKQEGERIEDILDIYQLSLPEEELRRRTEEAISLLESEAAGKLQDDKENRVSAWQAVYSVFEVRLLEDEGTLFYAKKALQIAEELGKASEKYQSVLLSILSALWRMNRIEEAKQYGRLYREALLQKYEKYDPAKKNLEELSMGKTVEKKKKLYRLFLLSFFTADYEKAREYMEASKNSDWCWFCSQKICMEDWIMEGYLAMHEGRLEEALAHFIKANDHEGDFGYSTTRQIRILKKKLEEQVQQP